MCYLNYNNQLSLHLIGDLRKQNQLNKMTEKYECKTTKILGWSLNNVLKIAAKNTKSGLPKLIHPKHEQTEKKQQIDLCAFTTTDK